MNITMPLPLYLAVAVMLLVTASAYDVALRIVPNRICLALGVDGLAIQASGHSISFSLSVMLLVFVPLATCWRHGLMGGGDVKLLTAVTLLVPPLAVPVLLLAVALAGGLLGTVYWTMMKIASPFASIRTRRGLRRVFNVERYRIRRGFSLPYAVAICTGTVCILGKSLIP